ncbi:mitotic deacetylase associated SANT domain protein a isoform X1, partial [Tachysurus ichikawai]
IPQIKQEQQEAGEESKHKAEQEDGGADHLRNVTKALQVSDNETGESLSAQQPENRLFERGNRTEEGNTDSSFLCSKTTRECSEEKRTSECAEESGRTRGCISLQEVQQ